MMTKGRTPKGWSSPPHLTNLLEKVTTTCMIVTESGILTTDMP